MAVRIMTSDEASPRKRENAKPTVHFVLSRFQWLLRDRTSVHDSLVDEVPRERVDLARGPEVLVLQHPDEREVVHGIDPEPGAGDAEPVKGSGRVGLAGGRASMTTLKSMPHPVPGAIVLSGSGLT